MQHTINLETDFKDFTFERTLAGSTKDSKRLDHVGFISEGEVKSFFKVYKNKVCVLKHGKLTKAIEAYNGIKG